MTRFSTIVSGCLLVLTLLSPLVLGQPDTAQQATFEDSPLDATPIRDLLRLFDTIVEANPDYQTTLKRFARLTGEEFRDSCTPYIQHNAENAQIASEVDALLASPAYQLYFQQFGPNAKRDAHRRVFFSLPYLAADAPGGIGEYMLEVCQHSRELQSLLDALGTQVDVDSCLAIAEHWLPSGEYRTPKTYLTYDGMETGYALNGAICYDLCAGIISHRSAATRFDTLSGAELEQLKKVLAHEYHHAHAEGLLASAIMPDWSWQRRWEYKLDSVLIYEGAAMQCDPRTGKEREVRQDLTVIRFWIDVLNRTFVGLNDGRISEPLITSWWEGDSDRARGLLVAYLQRRYPDANQDSLLSTYGYCRPDFSHTLGWWMVSQIANGINGHHRVLDLLSMPDSLHSWYNAAVGDADSTLRVTANFQ